MDFSDLTKYLTVTEGVSPASATNTIWRLRIFSKWACDRPFTKETVEAFLYHLQQQGKASNTLNAMRSALRAYERYLNDRGGDYHFMGKFKGFSTETANPKHALSIDEVKRLFSATIIRECTNQEAYEYVDETYMLLTKFIFYTGSRKSGIAFITVGGLDLEVGKAEFRTKGKNHMVNISEPLLTNIKEYLAKYPKRPDEYLFTNRRGDPVSMVFYARWLSELSKAARLSRLVNPHLLRKSFASHLKQNGADIADISAILGHKHISTTFANYIEYFDGAIKKIMQKHPMLRESLPPEQLLEMFMATAREFNFANDKRFSYEMTESTNEVVVKVRLRRTGNTS